MRTTSACVPAPPCADAQRACPGSEGEHRLQDAFGTRGRAQRFYRDQFRDRLFRRWSTSSGAWKWCSSPPPTGAATVTPRCARGRPASCACSTTATLAYPEYRGNGVMASLGNLSENPHIGLLMIDFVEDLIGLHVNGRAKVFDEDSFSVRYPGEETPSRYRAAAPSGGSSLRSPRPISIAASTFRACSACPRNAPGAATTPPVKAVTTSAPAPPLIPPQARYPHPGHPWTQTCRHPATRDALSCCRACCHRPAEDCG